MGRSPLGLRPEHTVCCTAMGGGSVRRWKGGKDLEGGEKRIENPIKSQQASTYVQYRGVSKAPAATECIEVSF